MKAERDDAPWRVKRKKNTSKVFIYIVLGSIIFWVAIFKFAQPIVIDVGKLKDGLVFKEVKEGFDADVSSQQTYERNAKAEENHAIETPAYVPRQEKNITEQSLNSSDVNSQGKQIVFNDYNYQPKTNINVIQSVEAKKFSSGESRGSQAKKVRSFEESGIAVWETGYKKERKTYHPKWVTKGDSIDYSTVCKNYPHGSIDYRDCRKAAKKMFAQKCRSNGGRFCHAENNYMP